MTAPLHGCTRQPGAAEKAMEFISAKRDAPWLLCLNFFDPHPPFDPPWEFYRRFDPSFLPRPHYRDSDLENQSKLAGSHSRRTREDRTSATSQLVRSAYYAMIELVDEQIGRVLDALAESGQIERTLIIFNSDHGEMLGDHGLTRKVADFTRD